MTMARHLPIENQKVHEERIQYRRFSLIELIALIVYGADRLALDEFHRNRPVFRMKNKKTLLFIQYLTHLREIALGIKDMGSKRLEIIEAAYDMTLDKFNNMPYLEDQQQKNCAKVKQSNSDCRLYFKAFLSGLQKRLSTEQATDQLVEEAIASTQLKGFVRRHFYYSCLEAMRKNDVLYSRYRWEVNGGHVWLRLPKYIESGERSQWLQRNIGDSGRFFPKDKKIIQQEIDQHTQAQYFTEFNENTVANEIPCLWTLTKSNFNAHLADTVAHEKACNIECQRRAICALGPRKLKELVLRIFREINDEDYNCTRIAEDFGLSKATLSRFAGPAWHSESIPDLWQNTAYVLSMNKEFREIAKEAGVWPIVQQVKKDGQNP